MLPAAWIETAGNLAIFALGLAGTGGARFYTRYPHRLLITSAIILLLLSALALALGDPNAANDRALLAFYALVVGVSLSILESFVARRVKVRGEADRDASANLSTEEEPDAPSDAQQR